MLEEVKGLIENQGRAWEEFKSTNEQKIEQAVKKGVDAVTETKLQKIDADIQKSAEALQEINLKLSAVEKLAARPALIGKEGEDPEAKKRSQEFFKMLRQGAGPDGKMARLAFSPMEMKDGEVVVDASGGYYVPTSFVNRIVERVFETTPVRNLATIMTTSGDDVEFLANTADITANWVGETQSRSGTTATTAQRIRIPVRESEAKPEVTQKLLDDAYFDLEAYLAGKIGDRLGRLENAAFISGDGSLQPRGMTTYTTNSTDDSTRAWGQMQYYPIGYTSASAWIGGTNPGDPVIAVVYKLKTQHLANASWMIARDSLTPIRQLKNSVGGYLWQPSYQLGQPSTLLDYPVTIAPDMPAVASNALSIAFGNFKEGYTIVDRMGIRMLRDPISNKPFVQFYTTKRVGGDVTDFEAIKFLKYSAS